MGEGAEIYVNLETQVFVLLDDDCVSGSSQGLILTVCCSHGTLASGPVSSSGPTSTSIPTSTSNTSGSPTSPGAPPSNTTSIVGSGVRENTKVELELLRKYQTHPQNIRRIAPRTFERLVAAIYINFGWDTYLTQASKDGGCDVIVKRTDELLGQVACLVECKHYALKNKVGVEIVRALYGVVSDRTATKGVVVTSSKFTRGAKEFVNRNSSRLSLIDYDALVALLGSIRLPINC